MKVPAPARAHTTTVCMAEHLHVSSITPLGPRDGGALRHIYVLLCIERVGGLLGGKKEMLKLVHARIGEHECRVVLMYNRSSINVLMPFLFKKIDKSVPDLC